jgi:hypothetical protein
VSTEDRTDRRGQQGADGEHTGVEHYQVRVRGHLGDRWVAWFDGLELADEDDGSTVISGPVVDQAALHGLLQKVRDLGLTLVSLTRTSPGGAAGHPASLPIASPSNAPGAPS